MKAFGPMRARYSQKKRWFSNLDKTNSVMNCNEREPEPFSGLFGNSLQLMLGHWRMRIIMDSVDFAAVFYYTDHAPKIHDRAGAGDVAHPRHKRFLCH